MELVETILEIISKKEFYGPILVFCGAYILFKIINNIFSKLITNQRSIEAKRRNTLILFIENIVFYFLVIVSIFVTLTIYGFDAKTLIAGLGIVGLIVGLALQDTIKDFISGFTILIDNIFVVGDTIELRGFKGEVIALGLRTTKVKKSTGEVQIFANRAIDMVINYSIKASSIILEITVPYNTDEKLVENVLKTISPQLENYTDISKDGTEYLGIKDIVDSGVCHLYEIKCGRKSSAKVRKEAILIIKKAFDSKKIKITLE